MLINEQTKIAALLKQHPDALETIISLSPDFKKLRNPILRALMAGRTSIAMAAKIGGCTPQNFFDALKPLGFEVRPQTTDYATDEAPIKKPFPKYLRSLKPEQIIAFDVRTILAEGNDPLRQIQQKVTSLNTGEALKIINSFEPVPLIKLLERQGFQTFVEEVDTDVVETYFYKTNDSDNAAIDAGAPTATGDWEQVLQRFHNNTIAIDVRHLEMPQPMMTILESLENMSSEKALYVHHKRIPVFLLTELKERNFDYRIKEVKDGEVYLLIYKNN